MNPSTTTIGTTVKPQPVRRKRGIGFWTRRIFLGLLVLLVALPAAGATYQAVATAMDRRAYPALGQLVDVGGYRLHIHCIGEGSPTVILESGLPNFSSDWAWVQPEVAKTTRVCAYDRAGLGWSDASPHGRDAITIAAELHTLLQQVNIPGPYVMAGHSFGGKYIRVFAAQYPTEVVGMVLVDATHPDLFSRTPEGRAEYSSMVRISRLSPMLTRLGILRVTGFPAADPALPSAQRAELNTVGRTTQGAIVFRDEIFAQPATDAQVQASGTLGSRALMVLTAGDQGSPERDHVWRRLQDELAGLSSDSVHRIIEGANHSSLVHDRIHAEATSGAIRQVVDAVRTGQRLAW